MEPHPPMKGNIMTETTHNVTDLPKRKLHVSPKIKKIALVVALSATTAFVTVKGLSASSEKDSDTKKSDKS